MKSLLITAIKTTHRPVKPLTHGNYAYLREEIRRDGIRTPLDVTENYELIDGYRRLAVALELGILEIPVKIF